MDALVGQRFVATHECGRADDIGMQNNRQFARVLLFHEASRRDGGCHRGYYRHTAAGRRPDVGSTVCSVRSNRSRANRAQGRSSPHSTPRDGKDSCLPPGNPWPRLLVSLFPGASVRTGSASPSKAKSRIAAICCAASSRLLYFDHFQENCRLRYERCAPAHIDAALLICTLDRPTLRDIRIESCAH